MLAACAGAQEVEHGLELAGSWGGTISSYAVSGDRALLGIGRRLMVLDVADIASPALVATTAEFSGWIDSIAISGNHAYVGKRSSGLEIVDVTDPASPVSVGTVYFEGYGLRVVVSGSFAYITSFGRYALVIVDVHDPRSPYIVGRYEIDAFDSAVSGVAIAGRYAYIAGLRNGFLIVDISDPARPTLVGSCSTGGSTAMVVAAGNYAYVVDYFSGFRVIDISEPTRPVAVSGLSGIHGWVELLDERTLVVLDDDVQLIDVSVPTAPVLTSPDQTSSSGGSSSVQRVLATVRDDSLVFLDLSNPAQPREVGSYLLPPAPYTAAFSGGYAFVASPLSGVLGVVDISDPKAMSLVATVQGAGGGKTLVRSGDYLYMTTFHALKVIDISTPTSPTEVAQYADLEAQIGSLAVDGQYVYLTTLEPFYSDESLSTLVIIDVSNPTQPVVAGRYELEEHWDFWQDSCLAVADGFAYVAGYSTGLDILDVSDPHEIRKVASYATNDVISDVEIVGNYAYLVRENAGLAILDISDPVAPLVVGHYSSSYGAHGSVAVSGSLAYVCSDASSWDHWGNILDVSNPVAPLLVGRSWSSAPLVSANGRIFSVRDELSLYNPMTRESREHKPNVSDIGVSRCAPVGYVSLSLTALSLGFAKMSLRRRPPAY